MASEGCSPGTLRAARKFMRSVPELLTASCSHFLSTIFEDRAGTSELEVVRH